MAWEGGDGLHQNDSVFAAFIAQFPKMTVTNFTDLSKYHDARLDLALLRGQPVPDVAHLQTLQDFPRWRDEGHLLAYKPPPGGFPALSTFEGQTSNADFAAFMADRTAAESFRAKLTLFVGEPQGPDPALS